MAMAVEYLVVFRRNDKFCDSPDSFNRLLSVETRLVVEKGSIYFDRIRYGYQVKAGEVVGKQQRYFHLRFSCEGAETDQVGMDNFSACLRAVRAVVKEVDCHVVTISDDISSAYCRSANPLIHDIEILMRKLIATFMLTTVGLEWEKEAAPKDVKDAISKSKRKPDEDNTTDYGDVLQTIDFCHLGDILFKKYTTRPFESLHDMIGRAKTNEDLDLGSIKECLPRSNWQRYFSSLVSCNDDYLRTRWDKLYDLRCWSAPQKLVQVI